MSIPGGAALAVLATLGLQQPTPSPSEPQPTQAEYRVGIGDTLDITVFENPDLSRTATIQTDGTIALPLLGEVPVAGMTVPEARDRITTLLERDYLVAPQVAVRVEEYNSQFVFVVGELTTPGRHALKGPTRLIDLLSEADGFTTRASGDLTITRADGTFADGSQRLELRLRPGEPADENLVWLEMPLRSGDIITAAPKRYVTIDGEIERPGRFVLDEGLTVSGVVSLAGGLTRFGSSKVKVRRPNPDDQTAPAEVIEVNLKSVRQGKEPDLLLQAGDLVTVPRKLF